jgi:hypothetical protein
LLEGTDSAFFEARFASSNDQGGRRGAAHCAEQRTGLRDLDRSNRRTPEAR